MIAHYKLKTEFDQDDFTEANKGNEVKTSLAPSISPTRKAAATPGAFTGLE